MFLYDSKNGYSDFMVLSSPDNQGGDSPSFLPDVAACRGKSWLVRLQRGLGGATPPFYAIREQEVGRHGNGCAVTRNTLPIQKYNRTEGGAGNGATLSPQVGVSTSAMA